MKKFGILYICTGKYDVFWKDFYDSCEKYLLKNCDIEKHYFVWTDSDNIKGDGSIHVFYQENLGWPDNTLKRFHIFLSQKKELEKVDYLFFFNANLELKMPIGEEILPKSDDMIIVVSTDYFISQRKEKKFPYERNPLSTAFIRRGEGNYYVRGGLNGGTSHSFLGMCKTLSLNIDTDKNKGVVAVWHDESHLNRYIYDLEMNGHRDLFKILPPSYLCMGEDYSFPCKILIRDKSKYIDEDSIKKKSKIKIILDKIYKIYRKTLSL